MIRFFALWAALAVVFAVSPAKAQDVINGTFEFVTQSGDPSYTLPSTIDFTKITWPGLQTAEDADALTGSFKSGTYAIEKGYDITSVTLTHGFTFSGAPRTINDFMTWTTRGKTYDYEVTGWTHGESGSTAFLDTTGTLTVTGGISQAAEANWSFTSTGTGDDARISGSAVFLTGSSIGRVPEPGSLAVLAVGLVGVGAVSRRRHVT